MIRWNKFLTQFHNYIFPEELPRIEDSFSFEGILLLLNKSRTVGENHHRGGPTQSN
jgi:hypothetical protein